MLWVIYTSALALSVMAGTANLPPKIALIQPSNGAVFTDPVDIQVMIESADADGFVRTVELLSDLGSLCQLTADPATAQPINAWQWTWTAPSAGDHKLVARATDNEGAVSYSDSVVFTVSREASPTGATLVIVKPADGDVFTASPVVVSIQVTAVDPLADIRHVEFYANDLLIGRSDQLTKDAVIPGKPRQHFLDWSPVEAGRYKITAQAADSQANPVVSKPVSVTIAPGIPIVSLEATVPETAETAEPAPNIRVRPGVFTLRRSGDAANPLTVYLAYEGSALPGLDYTPLPEKVVFPAGASSVELLVGALEDSAAEGIETVAARLVDPPFDRPPDYVIDPARNVSKVLIDDNGLWPGAASLVITTPKDGDSVKPGQPISVSATAIDPNGYTARVEFYDFETQIGVSQLEFFRAPDPGTPIYHAIEWKDPPSGEHSLTARAVDSQGQKLVSVPVRFQVAAEPVLPVVRIKAVDAEATELSPLVNAIDPARFQITREGDLSRDLYVVFSLHGTAEPDKDYKRPDRLVRIPAGESTVALDIVPLSDELAESMETVAIRLEDPLPMSWIPVPPTPYAMPDETRQAVAVIYDRNRPEQGALELALPGNGETCLQGQPLVILAAAFHPTAVPGHADFFAGGKFIGSSDIVSDKTSSGGLAVHRFDWKEPIPGEQVITARAKLADGSELVSSSIHITVRALNPEPVVSLLRPSSGAVFAAGDRVEIGALTRIPSGSFQRLEILADDNILASAEAPELSIALTTLTPGPHVLVARAVDSLGTETLSTPVKILIWEGNLASAGATANTAQLGQIARSSGSNIRLQLNGPANGLCLLEVSSDLVNWSEVPPMFLPDGQIALEQDAKTGPNCRFYRTRLK